ncbi:MAG TPA: ABC transporter substrate-binding protein [Candidatus Competibacter sp.]|nr:ABC transporter substrate-binding protein [Candidatus Competibacter sp.]
MSKRINTRAFSKLIGKFEMTLLSLIFVALLLNVLPSFAEESGITEKVIRIGASDPLEGDAKAYGQNLKKGIDTALTGQVIQKRTIEFEMLDDRYAPEKSVENTRKLIDKGVFAMVGSFGSATTQKVLPILAEHKVPAFGFYTGVGFTGPGDVLNFRPSSTKEVEAMSTAALASGVKPTEICAYVQNDEFGMSGLKGLRAALSKQSGAESIISKLDQLIAMTGDQPPRNNVGPVGVHNRNSWVARDGYLSLKNWEKESGTPCRLVITTTLLEPTAMFIGYSRYKNEPWVFSAISVVSGDNLSNELKDKGVTGKTEKIITTQVLPALDASLPIISEARKALGNDLNYISLEGYIVARLFVEIMKAINGPLTHEAFLKAARLQPYDIGGIKVDFTTDNQGSDFVGFTVLKDGLFTPIPIQEMAALFNK